MAFLFDAQTGLYGNRPGNPWRYSRRKWIERFILIQDKQSGEMVPFKLNETQRALEAVVLRQERAGLPVRTNTLKARQHGVSTYVAAVIVHQQLTVKNFRALLMGHKRGSASAIQGRLLNMIEEIRHKDGPRWLLHLDKSNRNEIVFARPFRSSVLVDSAESPDFRGDTLRGFHAIEPAEWPKAAEKANAVLKCIPKAAGTFVFVEGTARGDTGWFAETWKAAWKSGRDTSELLAGTRALFFPWYIHEKYRWSVVYGRPLPQAAIDEIKGTLTQEEQRLLQRTYLRRGVGLVSVDYDQLAWRRMAIQEECQGRVEFFHQEYPSTPEEAFQSTGLRFFNAATITETRDKYAQAPAWRGDTLDPEGEALMMQKLDELEATIR
jgi:hypothetical protein